MRNWPVSWKELLWSALRRSVGSVQGITPRRGREQNDGTRDCQDNPCCLQNSHHDQFLPEFVMLVVYTITLHLSSSIVLKYLLP